MKTHTLLTSTSLAALTVAVSLGAVTLAKAAAPNPNNGQNQRPAITADQQATLDQVRSLREEGKFAEAKDLAKQAGLPFGMMMRRNAWQKNGKVGEQADAVRTAIENNDYQAFVKATANAPFADKVTEEMFSKMVEAHNLRASGDLEGAKAIMDELELPPRPFMGRFGGRGCMQQPQSSDANQQ